jgi:hypothetical protein
MSPNPSGGARLGFAGGENETLCQKLNKLARGRCEGNLMGMETWTGSSTLDLILMILLISSDFAI